MKVKDERRLTIELDGALGYIIRQNPDLTLSDVLLNDLQELVDTLKQWYEADEKNRSVTLEGKVWRGLDEILKP